MGAFDADIAVIGLGLIGAAALRHVGDLWPGARLAGVGAAEPADFTIHAGVFASHYDSGRITRKLDRRPVWARLAIRSIAGYADIEARSGIAFHRGVGVLFADPRVDGMAELTAVADALGISYRLSTIAADDQPDERLHFDPRSMVLREPPPAGHIDPRRLIAAQLAIATAGGAAIERCEARRIEPCPGGWRVFGDDDALLVTAETLVVAAGPHTDELHGLPVRPHLRVHAETVVMAVLGDRETERLAGLPSGISIIDHPVYEDFYFVPPTDYPDGSTRLKLGATMHRTIELPTVDGRRTWMRGSAHAEELPALRGLVEGLVPGIDAERWETRPCMITETPTGLPYLDIIDEGLVIAAGGNGFAAKSSDAIGALAAGLAVNGSWTDSELDAEDFRMLPAPSLD